MDQSRISHFRSSPSRRRIDAELAENQRARVRDHLQAGQIILEGALLVEINVEANEVDVLRPEELGRGIIAEGAEALGIDALWPGERSSSRKFAVVAGPAPADDIGLEFVDHAPGENGRVPGARPHRVRAQPGRPAPGIRASQENRDAWTRECRRGSGKSKANGQVQHARRGGRIIDAQEVGAKTANQLKIEVGVLATGKRFAVGVRGERPVGHALDIKFLLDRQAEKFPAHRWRAGGAKRHWRCRRHWFGKKVRRSRRGAREPSSQSNMIVGRAGGRS